MIYIKNTTDKDIYDWKSQYTFVPNELLTEHEFKKFMPLHKPEYFTRVSVPKNKTYKFFSVRFEMED